MQIYCRKLRDPFGVHLTSDSDLVLGLNGFYQTLIEASSLPKYVETKLFLMSWFKFILKRLQWPTCANHELTSHWLLFEQIKMCAIFCWTSNLISQQPLYAACLPEPTGPAHWITQDWRYHDGKQVLLEGAPISISLHPFGMGVEQFTCIHRW